VISDNLKEYYFGKKVLITGETGFKGSWLAIWLHNLGAIVYGLSLPPVNIKDNYNLCNLSGIVKHNTVDIRDSNEVINKIKSIEPHIIFHLAAQPLVSESYINPRETFEINVMGTINILDSIRITPSVKSGIIITSDKCYANQEWLHGYRENDPLGGNDPYSASKGACEIVTHSYQSSFFNNEHSPGIATVRAGNVIGGGDRSKNRIFPDFVRAIESGDMIKIRFPNAIRPWQHVLEPLSGYILLGYLLGRDKKKYSQSWNFGPLYSNSITVRELVELIISIWGNGSYECIPEQSEFSESSILILDIAKTVMLLKWYPVLNINETIKWTIEEYEIENKHTEIVYQQRVDHIHKYMNLMNQVTKILS